MPRILSPALILVIVYVLLRLTSVSINNVGCFSQDDPLSALDVHVMGHVMKTGITNFLLRDNRTVILTTHQLQHLKRAHHVCCLTLSLVLYCIALYAV